MEFRDCPNYTRCQELHDIKSEVHEIRIKEDSAQAERLGQHQDIKDLHKKMDKIMGPVNIKIDRVENQSIDHKNQLRGLMIAGAFLVLLMGALLYIVYLKAESAKDVSETVAASNKVIEERTRHMQSDTKELKDDMRFIRKLFNGDN